MEKVQVEIMDDGELELSEKILLQSPGYQESTSVDALLDEFMKTTCTHTHTCNPPGPNTTHTHTCYHTHTRVISSGEDESTGKQRSLPKSKKPLGNREAVRKYREKKKAHTTYLEEEVKKLNISNQQLLKKLKGCELLEAEVFRLRALLVELRGKVDGELGIFPFQKPCDSTNSRENCGIHCGIITPCLDQNSVPLLGDVVGHDKVSGLARACDPSMVDSYVKLHEDVSGNLKD